LYIWGLGIGDWGLGPIPNPQAPIPKIREGISKVNQYSSYKYTNTYTIILT